MVEITKLSGRLGNQMWQLAYLFGQMMKGNIPDIYVQNPDHFGHCLNEVRAMYSQGIIKNDYVGIHVRRGDYVNNPFYVDLMKTDYYQKSMAKFPNERFMVYSDDISWCKEQPIFENCEFSHGTELEDMNSMAGGKGVITANSSFSVWAGMLCEGKVVAPKEWYTDGLERSKCPIEWLRI